MNLVNDSKNIFTPNGNNDKHSLYISRKNYENKISILLNEKCNYILNGPSGTGKSWIIRKVLKSNNYYHRFIDLKEVLEQGTLSNYLSNKLIHYKWRSHCNQNFSKDEIEKYYHNEFIKFMINKSNLMYRHNGIDKDKNYYIIFEHFEEITNNHLLIKEINNFILEVNQLNHINLKIIILSANNNVLNFINNFSKNSFNRLVSLEVFTHKECVDLMDKGFSIMNLSFSKPGSKHKYYYNIITKSRSNPKVIQSICYNIVDESKKNNLVITGSIIDNSIRKSLSLLTSPLEFIN